MNYFMPSGDWPLYEEPYIRFMKNLGHKQTTSEDADFLLLPGGSDFGARPNRDETEIFNYHLFLQEERPVIGICRGMQLILKVNGGNLIPHIPDEMINLQHTTINGHWKGLSSWHMTKAGLFTNTRHHQGYVEIPESWELVDSTTDGIVEAVKRNNEFGVQWHPELPEMDGTAAQDWFIWKMEQTIK
jgi:gamma-glutamyl-gamma-aminobutyrate hydrolase PuuD